MSSPKPKPKPKPKVRLFYTSASPFSNFHPTASFTLAVFGTQKFRSSEAAYMALKATHFNDHASRQKIFDAKTPMAAKTIGREVKGFDRQDWDAHCEGYMETACLAKFSSDPHLKSVLLGTGEEILAEAAPHDLIWGIGLGETNPLAKDPSKWRGKNLLGKVLMSVRTRLRTEEEDKKRDRKRKRDEADGDGDEDRKPKKEASQP